MQSKAGEATQREPSAVWLPRLEPQAEDKGIEVCHFSQAEQTKLVSAEHVEAGKLLQSGAYSVKPIVLSP